MKLTRNPDGWKCRKPGKNGGGLGVGPLGLLPLWGREGVTLVLVLIFNEKMDCAGISGDLYRV